MTDQTKIKAQDQANQGATDTTKPEAKKATPKKVKALKIIAKQDGFRRAGFEFGAEATIIKVSDLKAVQVAMLKSEPMLLVSEATVAAG